MFKKVIFVFALGFFFVSCATVPTTTSTSAEKSPQEIVVKVQAAEPTKVTVAGIPMLQYPNDDDTNRIRGLLSQRIDFLHQYIDGPMKVGKNYF